VSLEQTLRAELHKLLIAQRPEAIGGASGEDEHDRLRHDPRSRHLW
jgi:hypothetical protein